MFLLVLTFLLTGLQYRLEDNERNPVLSFRFALLVLCVVVMVMTVFLNQRADWTSIGLFLASLGVLGLTSFMFLLMPSRKPRD